MSDARPAVPAPQRRATAEQPHEQPQSNVRPPRQPWTKPIIESTWLEDTEAHHGIHPDGHGHNLS